MNARKLLCSLLVIMGCARETLILEPGRVSVADVMTTQYRVSNIPYVDYLEARGSDLQIREGVEVWIGPERAELIDVDVDGILVHLAAPLAVGVYDLRVEAKGDHVRTGALQVVEGAPQDAATDAGLRDASRQDASPDAATGDASLCPAACELANASGVCRAGVCEVEACTPGFDDCDARPSNGCEINTTVSRENCGACGHACLAGEACVEGGCARLRGQVATGDEHSCAVLAGRVYCWGSNSRFQLGNALPTTSLVAIPVLGLTDAVAVAAGSRFSCALHSAGDVSCWGSNARGTLGDLGGDRPEPRRVDGIVDARSLSAGVDFACARLGSGQVRCWGYNSLGQLGAGLDDDDTSATPVVVTGISTAVDVDCGADHACAVLAIGRVRCWGNGASGGLGNGDTEESDVPVGVPSLLDATGVSANRRFTCATRTDAAGVCWGAGSKGQLGNGEAVDQRSPVEVASLERPIEFAAGLEFACYLLPVGSVHCWGRQSRGQLGTGIGRDLSAPPILPVLTDAVAVAAGDEHACALRDDGAVLCWGRNDRGQIGDGTTADSPLPVRVLGF